MKTRLCHFQLKPVQCSSVAAAIVRIARQAASTEPVDINNKIFAAKLSKLEQVMCLQCYCIKASDGRQDVALLPSSSMHAQLAVLTFPCICRPSKNLRMTAPS